MRIFILIITLFFFSFAHAAQITVDNTNFVDNPEVKIFINQMVTKYKFDKSKLITIFSTVKVRPKVIQNIKFPLEQKPWYLYRLAFLSDQNIAQGVIFWRKYQEVLSKAETLYGVPASIIVATIGIETKYGRDTGDFLVIDALVNLAFNHSPRAPYFRQELAEFLLLTRDYHLDPLKVTGSYAGAIGQPQFMPSSYRNYAVDFSGNHTIDLSHNEVDVIGSIANYYNKHGWKTNEAVAIPLALGNGIFSWSLTKGKKITQSEFIKQGLMPSQYFIDTQKSKILALQSETGKEYWLVFHDFDVIKRYNNSDLYAMAVFQLSYYIAKARENNHV